MRTGGLSYKIFIIYVVVIHQSSPISRWQVNP